MLRQPALPQAISQNRRPRRRHAIYHHRRVRRRHIVRRRRQRGHHCLFSQANQRIHPHLGSQAVRPVLCASHVPVLHGTSSASHTCMASRPALSATAVVEQTPPPPYCSTVKAPPGGNRPHLAQLPAQLIKPGRQRRLITVQLRTDADHHRQLRYEVRAFPQKNTYRLLQFSRRDV